ncbi:MAG: DUF1513 domain-containing protein [Pseudomonadota bacterium]
MSSMVIDRRSVLRGATAMSAAGLLPLSVQANALATPLFISSVRRGASAFGLVILNERGDILREIPLAARGHDAVVHQPTGQGVVFARRPGTFAVAFDLTDRKPPTAFQSPSDRHFYGHGVFSRDGRLLYATENDFDNARGVIGVYDVHTSFKRIGEFESHGVGPHDILLSPDGKDLVVANGGIETHPDAGRSKLNVADMRPSLVFLDRQTGDLIVRHELPRSMHKLSIRHLDMDARGTVWFGAQWEGGLDDAPSLVGTAGLEKPLSLITSLDHMGGSLQGYIGSVAMSADGRLLAASAPRAGRVLYIDTAQHAVVGETVLDDGCGVAPAYASEFAISSGNGDFVRSKPHQPATQNRHPALAFDNHMIAAHLTR